MAHFHNNALVGASGQGGYLINQSLRFNRPDTAYLSKIIGAGGATTKNAVSFWVKRSALGTQQALFQGRVDGNNQQYMGFTASNTLEVGIISGGSYILQKITSAVYRDTSAWYHVFFYQDNTLATAEDRYQLYVNGVRVTAWSTNTNTATQSNGYYFGANAQHYIAAYGGANTLDGYLAEFHFIYQPTTTPLVGDFGETDTITGAWIPKRYSGSYGTNGFYLKFEGSGIGTDSSGNGNTWTANNFSTSGTGTDVMSDTPTNNYATLSPLVSNAAGYLIPALNGNLEVSVAAGSNLWVGAASTQGITSGKFYWEITPTAISTSAGTWMDVGIIQSTLTYPAATAVGSYNGGFAYTNDAYKGRSNSYSAYGATWTTNDVIGVALDADNGSITFYKNGVSQGAAYTDLTNYNLPAGYYPAIAIYRNTGISQSAVFNFGQRAFAYTPPTGYKALNTANLPEPTIKKGDKYFDTKLYTGTGGSQSLSGLGFQPDLVWIKARSTASSHGLYDAVRGVGQVLLSNSTSAEQNYGSYGVTSFNSAGFSVNDLPGYGVNDSGQTYAAWCWDANGAGSSNTAGTITSTVSANATAGFSIATYTGTGSNASFGHGLGVVPSMCIIKQRNTAQSWWVWHQALGNNVGANNTMLELNGTAGTYAADDVFRGFTSSVVNIGTDSGSNTNGGTYVAYCFSEVAGYSKFGSYTGNGSTDGPFVFCGFRPRWILIKRSDSTSNWGLIDTSRDAYNAAVKYLNPDISNAEGTGFDVDILSNGFKQRVAGGYNGSGATYIFAAFAELPFKYANAR